MMVSSCSPSSRFPQMWAPRISQELHLTCPRNHLFTSEREQLDYMEHAPPPSEWTPRAAHQQPIKYRLVPNLSALPGILEHGLGLYLLCGAITHSFNIHISQGSKNDPIKFKNICLVLPGSSHVLVPNIPRGQT